MSKKELIKVNLFKYILLTNSEISIQTIMKRINLSKSTSLRYVSELGEDLLKSFNSVQLLIDEQGNYFIQKDKGYSNSLIIETLKEFYVRKSTLFQVFSAVMQKENLSIKDLEISLELAPSTVYNKLAILNDIAKTFKGKISFTQSGNIEGDEIGIRFFSYYLIWMLNKTNKDSTFSKKMPMEFLNLDNLKRNLITVKNLSASQEKKLKIAQGLALYRLLYRKQFIHLNKEFLDDIQFFKEDHFSITKTNKLLTSDVIETETLFFCYSIRGIVYDLDSFEKKVELVTRYKQSNLKIADDISRLLTSFSDYASFSYTEEGYIESYYLLLIVLIYIRHINIGYVDFYENTFTLKNYHHSIDTDFSHNEELISKFLNDPIFKDCLGEVSPSLIKEFNYLLYFILDINSLPKQLKIYVQFSKNIYDGTLIANSLKATFNESTILITKNPNEADFIISDTYEGEKFKAERFYFEDIRDYENWQSLLQHITNLIYRKSFFKNI